jgi:hypothetical protein
MKTLLRDLAAENRHGRVVTNSPFRLVDYRAMTEALNRNDYVLT